MTRRTIAIITPAMAKMPFLEFDPKSGRWRVWQQFNKKATAGTYLDLFPTGAVELITLAENGEIANAVTMMYPMKG